MIDEYRNVLCDECEEVLERKAYRIDYEGCYCIGCALHIAEEKLTNTGKNTDVCIDSVDVTDFTEEY